MTRIEQTTRGSWCARAWAIAASSLIFATPLVASADDPAEPPSPTAETPGAAPTFTSRPGGARMGTERRVPYRDGMPVPEGYHLEDSPRYGLVAGGVSVASTLWVVSMISAVALDKEDSVEGDPNFDDMYWPMFIPVVGPFATIGTADSSGTGAAILGLNGALQAAGVAMAIAGFAAPSVEVVEDYDLTLAPVAGDGIGGVSISGSF